MAARVEINEDSETNKGSMSSWIRSLISLWMKKLAGLEIRTEKYASWVIVV